MRLINELQTCLGVLLALILSYVAAGEDGGPVGDRDYARCPEGWISNGESTRCFKLVTFDRPRTFSHGFKACNDLGGTEVETRRRNGSRETNEYPVTLASVYKLSDEEAIRRTLLEQGGGSKTANGCFVGLRKYAFFRYPPGWYWIDSGIPVSARDSEISWTSSYNASWLLRFKFPFEKCGFFDAGGLGRRPCWLIDSELSCAVCGTVAYDSGGLNPNRYSELIRQTDEIISKEPRLDLPGYSSLNCTDAWENNLSVGLCQNVSSILDSAWSSYQSSLGFPSINFNWRDEQTAEGELPVQASYLDNFKYKQKKTFYWDQDPDSVPALSDEMKLIGLNAQPTYYPLKMSPEGDDAKETIYRQSSGSIGDILVPVTRPASRDPYTAGKKPTRDNAAFPKGESPGYASRLVAPAAASGLDSSNITQEAAVLAVAVGPTTTTTATTTTATTTTTSSSSSSTTTATERPAATTKATATAASSARASPKLAFQPTGKLAYSPRMENVRTNSYAKRGSSRPADGGVGGMYSELFDSGLERGSESSLLGFGAGESMGSDGDGAGELHDFGRMGGGGNVKIEKSVERGVDVIERRMNKRLIFGFVVGLLLFVIALMFFCVFFLRRRSEDLGSAQGLEDSSKEAIGNKASGLQLASIKPIFGRKGSKVVPMNQKSISFDSSMAFPEKKSVVSIEDTSFSPEYLNSGECGEGPKTLPYYVAQSQANTLQLHSARGANFGFDSRAHASRQIH
ncbi:C-type lectin containing protein [Cryptosporidium canis]|uniref:C-type lectin containing protein n=1 Tax=Cryptosporidium canis TaxID=195482 RepID=A0A9D5DMI0_9CRYT|nr:C-type lectin containing protein [Cryptosporidium canis]